MPPPVYNSNFSSPLESGKTYKRDTLKIYSPTWDILQTRPKECKWSGVCDGGTVIDSEASAAMRVARRSLIKHMHTQARSRTHKHTHAHLHRRLIVWKVGGQMVGAKTRLISICLDSVQQEERRAPRRGLEGYCSKQRKSETLMNLVIS